jgi:hypothetical protein
MKTNILLSWVLVMLCSGYSGVSQTREHGWAGHPGMGGGHPEHFGVNGGYGRHPDFDGGWRQHNNTQFGFYFGAPFYRPPYPYYRPYYRPYLRESYYYSPGYYPPTVITVPVTPPVYIRQPPPVVRQYPSGYWYYCNNPEGYYPYIKECPNGWQQVDPTPPPPR